MATYLNSNCDSMDAVIGRITRANMVEYIKGKLVHMLN
jgi:hypothetical protein